MRILIIGCGLIGALHAQTIHNTKDHELVLAEPRSDILNAVAAQVAPIATYADYRDALREQHCDAAFVCSPNALHAEHTIAALRAGCHVMCEKPMASTSEDAYAMSRTARQANHRLMIGYGMRVNRCVNKILEIIDSEELGRPVSARVVLAKPETLTEAKTHYRNAYATGGGILFDYSHELDYLGLFFGRADACACFKRLACCAPEDTCDDCADFIIRYGSGVSVTCHFDYIQEHGQGRGRWIGITFERGFVETDFVSQMRIYNTNGESTDFRPYNPSRWYSLEAELSMFLDLVAGNPMQFQYADAESAARIVELAEGLYRSSRDCAMVRFGQRE